MRFGVAGIEPNGLPQGGDGSRELSFLQQGDALPAKPTRRRDLPPRRRSGAVFSLKAGNLGTVHRSSKPLSRPAQLARFAQGAEVQAQGSCVTSGLGGC